MRRLVSVLKPTPATNVENQDSTKVDLSRDDIAEQLFQAIAPRKREAAFARVEIGFNNLKSARVGERCDSGFLVGRRISLLLGRHANVLSRRYAGEDRKRDVSGQGGWVRGNHESG